LVVSHVSQRPGLSHVEPTEIQAQTSLALHYYSLLLVLFIVCFIVCNKIIWIFSEQTNVI